jgi:hypothetical protein
VPEVRAIVPQKTWPVKKNLRSAALFEGFGHYQRIRQAIGEFLIASELSALEVVFVSFTKGVVHDPSQGKVVRRSETALIQGLRASL